MAAETAEHSLGAIASLKIYNFTLIGTIFLKNVKLPAISLLIINGRAVQKLTPTSTLSFRTIRMLPFYTKINCLYDVENKINILLSTINKPSLVLSEKKIFFKEI